MSVVQGTVITVPRNYAQWLECFEILKHRNISRAEYEALCCGECVDSPESAQYLEPQLVKTINAMIQRYIKEFKRQFELRMMFNERENLCVMFSTLAKRLNNCMFFTGLDFMSARFRKELQDSLQTEVKAFWDGMLRSLYSQCVDHNDVVLEHELYMIKRIKLWEA